MDPQLLQRTRYVLQARTRRATTCPPALFGASCEQLLSWATNHPILGAIVARLAHNHAIIAEQVSSMCQGALSAQGGYNPGRLPDAGIDEHAAICLGLVRGLAVGRLRESRKQEFLWACVGEYLTGDEDMKADDALTIVRDVAVEGFYEYLDEQIDTRNMVLGIVAKYKQRCEWFYRERLRRCATDGLEGKNGERALALDLQEYVFDQGVEFVVEPTSASGEVDLVLRDAMGQHLVLDAKFIRARSGRSEIKRQLAQGFHQVLRYCDDFDEPFGILAVFIDHNARFRLPLLEADGFHFLTIGGKTVYYVEIRINDAPSASRSGTPIELTFSLDDLVQSEISGDGPVPSEQGTT